MNHLKKSTLASSILILSLFSLSNHALADEASSAVKTSPTHLLVYINPVFYEYPVHLLHPYLDYWHTRGPMFEKIAADALSNSKTSAQSCRSNIDTNFTIALEPYMFYKPQLRIFHSEVIANVYAGKLEPIATYKATAQEQGELNNIADYYLKRVYTKSMQNIVTQMQSDTHITSNQPSIENNLCTLLNRILTTRRYF